MLRRVIASRAVRVLFVVAAVGLGVLAVVRRWHDVEHSLVALSPVAVGLSALAVLAGLIATMLSWRALLADLGSPLPVRAASRIFFLGQLGKYLPGSLWPVLAQAELGHEYDVPRRRSAAVALLTVGFALVTGLTVAAVTLPLLSAHAARHYWPVLVVVPLLLAVLHPRVLNPLLSRALRMIRRPPLEHPLSSRGVAACFGWAVAAWLAFGVQVWALARDTGGHGGRLLPLAIGGFALAWSVGFLVVFVPAGVGVREAALTAALAPVLPRGGALVVALVSRVLMSGGDLVCAGIAVVASRGPARELREVVEEEAEGLAPTGADGSAATRADGSPIG